MEQINCQKFQKSGKISYYISDELSYVSPEHSRPFYENDKFKVKFIEDWSDLPKNILDFSNDFSKKGQF